MQCARFRIGSQFNNWESLFDQATLSLVLYVSKSMKWSTVFSVLQKLNVSFSSARITMWYLGSGSGRATYQILKCEDWYSESSSGGDAFQISQRKCCGRIIGNKCLQSGEYRPPIHTFTGMYYSGPLCLPSWMLKPEMAIHFWRNGLSDSYLIYFIDWKEGDEVRSLPLGCTKVMFNVLILLLS